tara:strand:+ start:700 stop:879 length:180 start_codon:yes stop_codon:yes gene_type:complete
MSEEDVIFTTVGLNFSTKSLKLLGAGLAFNGLNPTKKIQANINKYRLILINFTQCIGYL